MSDIPFHPLANIFPLIDGAEFDDLVSDIRRHGQRETIKLFDQRILDGRNRYRACLAIGVKPRTEPVDGDPLAYVISANLRRRHLSESQRGMIAARLANMPVGRPWPSVIPSIEGITQEQAADMLNVGVATVERASAVLASNAPDIIEAIDHGLLTVSAATHLVAKPIEFQDAVIEKLNDGLKLAEAKRQARKEQLPATIAAFPEGQFRVVYADPPWAYNDGRNTGDHRESTGALDHYNVEGLEALKEFDVKSIAAPDSVLFCWATFPLLADALALVAAWGFKYKTAFVWDKGHGAFGNYHDADAELLLVATRGSCLPEADKKEKQIQRFPRGKHSAKPDEWRDLIDRLYPSGPRIELFRRGDRPAGWTIWGAEAAEDEAA